MIEAHTDEQAAAVVMQLRTAGFPASMWVCKGFGDATKGAWERWHITSDDIHPASFPLLGSLMSRRSFSLDVGRADHLAPLLGFFGDMFPEFGRRARHQIDAEMGKPRLQLVAGPVMSTAVGLVPSLRNDGNAESELIAAAARWMHNRDKYSTHK
jgi:hypothetical protein